MSLLIAIAQITNTPTTIVMVAAWDANSGLWANIAWPPNSTDKITAIIKIADSAKADIGLADVPIMPTT